MKNSFDVKIYDKAPFGFVLLRVDPADGGDTVAISIEYANTPFEEMLKIGSLQKGTPFESLFPKPYVKAQKFIALIREVHKTAISREVEYFSTRNRRWFKFSLFSPEPTFIAAIGIDITEEKYLSDLAEEIFQGYDELVHRFCVLGRTTQAALGTYDSTRKVLEIRASTRDGLKPWISETVLSWPLIKSIPGVEVLPLVYSDLLLGAFLFLPKDPIEEKTRALQQRFGAQVAGRLYKESIQATLKKNDEVFRQMSAQVPGFLFSL